MTIINNIKQIINNNRILIYYAVIIFRILGENKFKIKGLDNSVEKNSSFLWRNKTNIYGNNNTLKFGNLCKNNCH